MQADLGGCIAKTISTNAYFGVDTRWKILHGMASRIYDDVIRVINSWKTTLQTVGFYISLTPTSATESSDVDGRLSIVFGIQGVLKGHVNQWGNWMFNAIILPSYMIPQLPFDICMLDWSYFRWCWLCPLCLVGFCGHWSLADYKGQTQPYHTE